MTHKFNEELFVGHTPGPWTCHEMTREVEVEAPCGRMIWIGNVHSDDCVLADAHLIAAAPELLEANRELTRQVEQLQERIDAADKAMSAAESFISVMFGRGPDALIPETVNTPLGIPVQLRKIMLDLMLAQSITAPPSSSDPGRADTGRK